MMTHRQPPKGAVKACQAKHNLYEGQEMKESRVQVPSHSTPNLSTLYPKHPMPGELPAAIGMELPLEGSQEQVQLHPFPWGATLGREDQRGGWEAYFFRPLCQDWSPFEGKGQRKQKKGSNPNGTVRIEEKCTEW